MTVTELTQARAEKAKSAFAALKDAAKKPPVKKPPVRNPPVKKAAVKNTAKTPAKKAPARRAASTPTSTQAGDVAGIGQQGRLEWLPAHAVHPDPQNPRQSLGDLDELAASIVQLGILEPLIVTDHPTVRGEWMIVAGHRRHAAAGLAGLLLVPAVIRTFDDVERRLAMLVENLHRRDLDPFDEARGYQMLADLGLSQRDIAERVGCSQPHVSRRLKLRVLRKEIVELFLADRLTIRQAEQIADLDEGDVDAVCKAVAKSSNDMPVDDWQITNAVDRLTRARKHAKALEQAEASKLPKTDATQWTRGWEKVKKAEATHWHLGDSETTVTWLRKVDTAASTATGSADSAAAVARSTSDLRAETEAFVLPCFEARQAAALATCAATPSTATKVGLQVLAHMIVNDLAPHLSPHTVGELAAAGIDQPDPGLLVAAAALCDAARMVFAAEDHPAGRQGYWACWLHAEPVHAPILGWFVELGYTPTDFEQAWYDSATAALAGEDGAS